LLLLLDSVVNPLQRRRGHAAISTKIGTVPNASLTAGSEAFLETLLNSYFLVFAGEMGDKNQLLSLVLMARYKKPWTILAGVTVATLLNHALASGLDGIAAAQVSPQILKWSLALTFFAFAGWILVPDKEGEIKTGTRFGAFVTTVIAFFIAEMGDKTQLATIALGARYSSAALVTLGTTAGMISSNALAVFLGERLLSKVPMNWVRITASVLFAAFGILILFRF
jgi:putative Ca2+/H+ antiporter (TMEM165/GDT1 family)